MRDAKPQILLHSFWSSRHLLWVVLRFLVLLYVGTTLFGCAVINRMMYPVPPPGYVDGPDILKLPLEDGRKISAQFYPHDKPLATILYFHGNGEDIGLDAPLFREFQAAGFQLLGVDYPGYGTSDGSPDEAGTYAAGRAGYRYVTDQGIPPADIILLGRSLGGGIAVELATTEPVGGLILESTFVSAVRVITKYPLLPFDRYRNLKKIKRVTCPIFVIHGMQDEVISFWHGEKLFATANDPKRNWWVPEAGHNNLFRTVGGPEYFTRLKQFVAWAKQEIQ